MTSFQTKKQNIKAYVLWQILGCITIFALVIFYDFYISAKQNLNNIFYVTMGSLTVILLTIEVFKKRIFNIQFDDKNEQIHFKYKDFFSRESSIVISYSTARIEIDRDTSVFSWFRKSTSLYFLKNKTEICSISKRDGFTYDQLEKIILLIERLTEKTSN